MKTSNGVTFDENNLYSWIFGFLRSDPEHNVEYESIKLAKKFFSNENNIKLLDDNNFEELYREWRGIDAQGDWEGAQSYFLTWILLSSDVDFLTHMEYIPKECFAGMLAITNANIPEGIIEIQKSAFSLCKNLVTVRLPHSLNYVESGAFDCCEKLEVIHYAGTKEEFKKITFENIQNMKSGIKSLAALKAIRCSDGDLSLEEFWG